MNTERDFERITMDWLNAGSDSTPLEVIDAVLLAVRSMPQERDLRISWRALSMRLAVTAAAVITVVVILGLAAYFALGPRANVGTDSTPSPTLPAAQAPSPAATPHGSPVDTSGWTTFQSARYGFSIGHPSDWTEVPADHDWALATDAANWLSTGQEVFKAPGDAIRVSAWSEPIDGSVMTDASDIEAWVQTYCEQLNSGPCNGIHDRVVHSASRSGTATLASSCHSSPTSRPSSPAASTPTEWLSSPSGGESPRLQWPRTGARSGSSKPSSRRCRYGPSRCRSTSASDAASTRECGGTTR